MGSIDSIYYRHAGSLALARRIAAAARSRMYRLMVDRLQIGSRTSIVDIGVSDEERDEANMLEKLHPWPANITCAGLGDGAQSAARYPGARFVKIVPGAPLPFSDGQFDVACANAVLEHLGARTARQGFIAEMCRVAKCVFITVPNRWFPVEHHTGVPLLHWQPALFRKVLRRSAFRYWADPAHLDFLDRATLLRDWPCQPAPDVVHAGLNLGPISSNLAAIWRARPIPE